jgi:L-fuconolactonase
MKNVPAMNRSYDIDDYTQATIDCNVRQYICIEAAVAAHQSRQEFDWLQHISASDSRLAGIVAYANVARGTAVQTELDYLASSQKVKGIRLTLGKAYQKNPKLCVEKDFIKGVQCLRNYELSFDLAFDSSQFVDIYAFAKACPDIQLVIDHTGKPAIAGQTMQPWLSSMKKLAQLPNVVCKISDILRDSAGKTDVELFQPFIDKLVEMFGMQRLLFGSDFPIVTMYGSYTTQLQVLTTLFKQFSDSEQQHFFCKNAQRIYRLPQVA